MSSKEYCHDLEMNLKELLRNGRIGLSYIAPRDMEVVPNKFVEVTTGYKNFHFKLKIPYAGKKLTWEIIFDPEDYSALPDFDFNDDYFLANPDADYIFENVENWANWNLKQPTALVDILNEFLGLYKMQQVKRLTKENIYFRYKNDYEDLLVDIGGKNIEVHIDNYLNFLISLPVEEYLNQLPQFLQPDKDDAQLQNPGEDFAHLLVTFLKLDNSHIKVSLQFSPRLDQVLGKLKLPKYTEDTTLSEYVSMVKTVIDDRIQFIIEQVQKKKQFVSSLASIFSTSIVEYDTKSLNKVVFLYDIEDYNCLVIITVGSNFPIDKPKIQLYSIMCQESKHCIQVFDDFMYDPQDTVEEMVHKIIESLKYGVISLKNHKH